MEACEDDLVEAREDGLVEACEDDLVKAKYEDISDFDKGQIVMARRLGLSISKTAGLVGCSQNAVVSIYKKWCKEGHPLTRRQGRVYPKALLRGGRKGPLKREGSEG